jgi:hypothetical protein
MTDSENIHALLFKFATWHQIIFKVVFSTGWPYFILFVLAGINFFWKDKISIFQPLQILEEMDSQI